MLIGISSNLPEEVVASAYAYHGPAKECVVWLAIDERAVSDRNKPLSVEFLWGGNSLHASTEEGIATASQYGTGDWCWISTSLPPAVVPGRCAVFVRRAGNLVAQGEIELREHVPLRNVTRSDGRLNELLGELLLRTARPVLNIHLWHEDVAREIAALPGPSDRHFEIRLLTPENLDESILDIFLEYLRSNHCFRSVSRLTVPARGRDVGGLVGMLRADGESKQMGVRPQLFTHTKKSSYLPPLAQADWRRGLLSSLAVGRNLRCAMRQLFFAKTAIVCAGERACVEPFAELAGPRRQSVELAESLAVSLFGRKPPGFTFSAGTMFWCRTDRTAKAWTAERLQYIADRLEPSESLKEPSYAHAFERLFPTAVADSGFRLTFL